MVFCTQKFFLFTQELVHFIHEILHLLPKKLRTPYSRRLRVPIHDRHLSSRVQCSHRATSTMWTTVSSGNPICDERHLSGRVECNHRATFDDINQSWDQANPIYELLYEFTLHCHLLGNLSIRSSPFWQQWFHIMRNCKHNNSGIWGPTRHLSLKITNSLAILRLRKPLKTSTRSGRPRDLNPGPPECESRALPRRHLAQYCLL